MNSICTQINSRWLCITNVSHWQCSLTTTSEFDWSLVRFYFYFLLSPLSTPPPPARPRVRAGNRKKNLPLHCTLRLLFQLPNFFDRNEKLQMGTILAEKSFFFLHSLATAIESSKFFKSWTIETSSQPRILRHEFSAPPPYNRPFFQPRMTTAP